VDANARDALLSAPLVKGLENAEVDALMAISQTVEAPAGQFIFREGEPGDGLYVVVNGKVEIHKRDRDGKDHALNTLSANAVFGEMSLIADGKRSASAKTAAAATLLKVPAAEFKKLVAGGQVAALKVISNLARILSSRLTEVNERLLALLDEQAKSGPKKDEVADLKKKLLSDWGF
jgi:CRP-like cAMP-binding protein